MELKRQIGLGDIKFGMKEVDVISLLGKPNLIVFDEDDEDQNPIYEYSDLRLRLTFYKDQSSKFGYLTTSNPLVTLNGQILINEVVDKVLNSIPMKKMTDWEIENYFSFVSYFNESNWLELNAEYKRITHVNMGVPFLANGDEYNWPN